MTTANVVRFWHDERQIHLCLRIPGKEMVERDGKYALEVVNLEHTESMPFRADVPLEEQRQALVERHKAAHRARQITHTVLATDGTVEL